MVHGGIRVAFGGICVVIGGFRIGLTRSGLGSFCTGRVFSVESGVDATAGVVLSRLTVRGVAEIWPRGEIA